MNISRDEFVNELLDRTKNLENTDLAEFFASLNGEKEAVFGNIYDATFSKKLCEVRENILNSILIAFVGSESSEPENKWLIDEIDSIIPETKQLFNNINYLLKQPTVESPKLEFDENYTEMQIIKDVKNSQASLFELFATENGQKELARNQLVALLKKKLSTETFSFVHDILKKMNILSYDVRGNKIIVDVTNRMEIFVLMSIRNYISPLKIINMSNTDILNDIDTLDKVIVENIGLKQNQLETVDIDSNSKEIIVKWNCHKPDQQKEYINQQILLKNNGVISNGFRVVEIDTSFFVFVNKYFDGFLAKSNLNALRHYCKVENMSFKNKLISIRIPDQKLWKETDQQICLNKNRFLDFFPGFSLEYFVIESNIDDKKYGNINMEEEPKKKLIKTTSPVSLKTDDLKTLDNFHALEKKQIQGIIDLIKDGKSIAITGTTGSGKTHLSQALKNDLKSELNTVYTTGEKFCSIFRGLAKNSKGDKNKANNARSTFLDGFEGIDVLIIDGIEYLGGENKGATQNILKQILTKNPDMRLVITSKTGIKDIARTKKHRSLDGAVGFESSSLFQEIKNLNLIMLQSPEKEKSEKIIQDQWKRFLNKKNDLFLPMELPVGVVNFLAKKVNPSLYEQIFESIKLNSSSNFSCEELFKIIQNLVSEKIRPEPEEIIDIIIDSFANNGKDISKHIALGTDITLWDKKEIEGRFYSEGKEDHLKKTMTSFCVFFIKQSYPKMPLSQICSYFGNRRDCNKLYNDALEVIMNRKGLNVVFEKNIKDFLLKTYGVDGQQISMF